jgi:hypothetical protein
MQTVQRLHAACDRLGIDYCIVGGLAVVRNGAPRTTIDVDLLIAEPDWRRLCESEPGIQPELDSAVDRLTGVTIDALFPGDEWEMEILMPQPGDIAEFDAELGGRFAGLRAILEIKAAVYRAKRRADGEAIAAKDLSDIVSLIEHHGAESVRRLTAQSPKVIAGELRRIAHEVARRR